MAGLPYTEEQMAAAIDQYAAEAGEEALERFRAAQTRREIASHYSQLLRRLGHEDTGWDLTLHLYRTYAKLPWYLYEDSRSTVQAVHERGYRIGVLSNTSHSARLAMTDLLGDLVPERQMIISEEEGVHKPAKTIYRRAAGRARTAPEKCLMVGDNFTADAAGAVNKGGFGYGVWLNRSGVEENRSLPPRVSMISSLGQLVDMLDALP
jgi:HAD superfamily hydrolase (TIGR01549 family)